MHYRRYILPDLSLGIIDGGRIQLLDILGAGAYGTIYRALDRTVLSAAPSFLAVKVLPLADRDSRRGVYQAREIGYHNYVSGHPNIVKLHRVVRDSQYLYIVLDYCPGGDMFRIVSQTRTFARNDTLIKNMFLQLCDAVDACHQNGIFHRDLKPENILVSTDLTRLYLSDFGLATRSAQSTNFGAGSSYYMSPECLNADSHSEHYDPRRGDIWALGVILTNMITGRCPWKRAAIDDECFRSYVRDPTFLRRMLPISTTAEGILKRVFTILPERSIDLQSLRQLVSEVDTFYITEEELPRASVHVKSAWKSYQPPASAMDGATLVDDDSDSIMESASEDESSSDSLEDDSNDSNVHSIGIGSQPLRNMDEGILPAEHVAVSSTKNPMRIPAQIQGVFTLGSAEHTIPSGPSAGQPRVPSSDDHPIDSSSSSSVYSSESSSDEDSDGPVTPETHAQDPDVVVPDFAESSGIGRAMRPVDWTDKKPQSLTRRKLLQTLRSTRMAVTMG